MLIYSLANEGGAARLGMTASGKVGNAVTRHRLKRWTREIFRRWGSRRSLPALDLVVHFKPEAGRSSFAPFRSELERLLAAHLPKERT